MGYAAQQRETRVVITKDNWEKLHADHPELFTEDPIQISLFTDLFSVEVGDTGDVISLFYLPEKWYETMVNDCLNIIAPYVKDGSIMSFIGEDNLMWGYSFKHGKWCELRGMMVCVDTETHIPHLKTYISEHLPKNLECQQLMSILDQMCFDYANIE